MSARKRTTNGDLACIVLAAGKGTRMRSAHAKVLHPLLGRPLVSYPVNLARELGADPVVAVLGHQRELVEAALVKEFGEGTVRTVEQAEQRGTGHAVRLAMPVLQRFGDSGDSLRRRAAAPARDRCARWSAPPAAMAAWRW